MTTMTTADIKLIARREIKGWPATATLGEVVQIAKRRFGKRLAGVVLASYSTGQQVEVRVKQKTYDGCYRVALKMTYELA